MTRLQPKIQVFVFQLFFLVAIVALTTPLLSAYGAVVLGDANVEPIGTSLIPNYVDALTKFTVTGTTTITSFSLYLSFTGSDGSQCLKFGIYPDNGGTYGQSSPLNEPLAAATGSFGSNQGFCFPLGNFGPGWLTWTLPSSEGITLNSGTYWLAVLAKENFGTIYHFTYTGAYPAYNFYNYGYFNYAFPASYVLGFPPVVFGNSTFGNYNIFPHYPNNPGEYNAPYSFYVTGT